VRASREWLAEAESRTTATTDSDLFIIIFTHTDS
jgi:hypothetical protein